MKRIRETRGYRTTMAFDRDSGRFVEVREAHPFVPPEDTPSSLLFTPSTDVNAPAELGKCLDGRRRRTRSRAD